MTAFKAACVQLNSGNDLAANLHAAETAIRSAAASGAQLIMLPEYAAMMDGSGRVLYSLNLAGAGVGPANDASLWLYTPGSGNTLLVREGESAPGTAGAT